MAQILTTENYQIYINDQEAINNYVKKLKPSSVFILTDENTSKHCLHKIFEMVDFDFKTITIHAGEVNKSIETAAYLWRKLMKGGADRKSLLINLGGGMVCDLGGFCASTYMRGIHFIHVPTTLLAQVDASIGGKTGIDIDLVKNIVGTFQMPDAVMINTTFLETLPYKELLSGYAEMLKHGLIADATIWQNLSSNRDITSTDFENEIIKSLQIKNNVVTKDPKESGLRKILNYGHTIGHALETINLGTESHLLHGEAIAIGMVIEAHLSLQHNLISQKDYDTIKVRIKSLFGNKYKSLVSTDSLMPIIAKDKKNHGGVSNFVMLESIGNAVFDIPSNAQEIELALMDYGK